jgi:hypothetical protein
VSTDIFVSSVAHDGRMAGVFECDDDVGYFYLYQVLPNSKVLDAIHVTSGKPEIDSSDTRVSWNSECTKVGLFIRGVLWAVFDIKNHAKFGGDYTNNGTPSIPSSAVFGPT